MECARDILGDPFCVFNLRNPLCQRSKHLPVVHFLEGFPIRGGSGDLAHEQDHGCRILKCGVHSNRGVGRTRTAGHKTDARTPGQFAPSLGHIGSAALLAAGHQTEPVFDIMQGVQDLEVAFAGDPESSVGAVCQQRINEGLSARARNSHLSSRMTMSSSESAIVTAFEREFLRTGTFMNTPLSIKTLETAILGGGCFWCLEAVFLEVEGVHSVVSGYAGGQVPNPSYEQVCGKRTGHVEVVRVEFDPVRISFTELLEIFFVIHDPTTMDRQGADSGPQYRSAIYATSSEQLEQSRAMITQFNTDRVFSATVVTQIGLLGQGADRFWPAEPEHQRYFERNPYQGYCTYVVAPKVEKFRQTFARRRRRIPL